MVDRKLFALAFTLCFLPQAFAQNRQDVLDLIARGKLDDALDHSTQVVKAKGVTSADFQIQGLLLASQGQMSEALAEFTAGFKIAPKNPTPTGLEGLPFDSPLMRKLSLVRGSFGLSNGQAALSNNVGLTLVVLGKMKDGFQTLEASSQSASQFPAPYVNQAVAHLLKDEGSKALSAIKKAISLGDNSVMARSILADADITVNKASDARDELKTALQDDPANPITLSVMARYCAFTGDSRGAEKYRAQALSYGSPIVVNGVLRPDFTKGGASGGNANEQHYNVDQRAFSAAQTAVTVNLKGDKENVDGRSDALQSLTEGALELGNKTGTIHFDYNDLFGGRPGTTIFEPGVISDPNANLAFHQANVYGDQFIGPVLLHGRFRTSGAVVSSLGSSVLNADKDVQYGGELKYDFTKFGGKNTAGFAYSHLNRNVTNALAIDPTEELLPNGFTDMWSLYMLHKRNLTPLLVLSLGGVIGRNGSAILADPYLDLALKLGQKNLLHVGFSSTFNSDVSDLMPGEMLAPQAVENPVDRNQMITTPYNQNPLLLTRDGRQQTVQVNLRTTVNPKLKFNTTAYHHDLQNYTIQGTDPQTATQINQNVFSAGHATGISEVADWDVAPKVGLKMKVYGQGTHMEPQAGLYNGTQPGAPVPLDLPYFPNLGLDLGVDYHAPTWTASIVAATIGHRTVATGVPLGNNQFCCSYIQIENPVTAWNLFAHTHLGYGEGYLAIYNLTKVSFYPGDPGRITFVIGVQL